MRHLFIGLVMAVLAVSVPTFATSIVTENTGTQEDDVKESKKVYVDSGLRRILICQIDTIAASADTTFAVPVAVNWSDAWLHVQHKSAVDSMILQPMCVVDTLMGPSWMTKGDSDTLSYTLTAGPDAGVFTMAAPVNASCGNYFVLRVLNTGDAIQTDFKAYLWIRIRRGR